MVFVDDEFYGNRDVPGPAGASLAFMLALGTVCFVVVFKDQIAACCRSSGGSLLLPSGRTYKNSDGSVVASHKSIEAAKELVLADKRPGCFTFWIQLLHPGGKKAQVRFEVGRDRKVTSNPVFVGLQAVKHSEAFIAKNGGVRRPISRGASSRSVEPFRFSPLTTTLLRGRPENSRVTAMPPGTVSSPPPSERRVYLVSRTLPRMVSGAGDRNAPLPPPGWEELQNLRGSPALAYMRHEKVCRQVAVARGDQPSPTQPFRRTMAEHFDSARHRLAFEKT